MFVGNYSEKNTTSQLALFFFSLPMQLLFVESDKN